MARRSLMSTVYGVSANDPLGTLFLSTSMSLNLSAMIPNKRGKSDLRHLGGRRAAGVGGPVQRERAATLGEGQRPIKVDFGDEVVDENVTHLVAELPPRFVGRRSAP